MMPKTITKLLAEWNNATPEVAEELMSYVYAELRKLAALHMARERGRHTMQPTELVHESFLRLLSSKQLAFYNRAHFFGIASRTMFRILVEHARKRSSLKRGANAKSIQIDDEDKGFAEWLVESLTIDLPLLIDLDRGLQQLETLDPKLREIVELRFILGMTIRETAEILGISAATVKNHWRIARAYLYNALNK